MKKLGQFMLLFKHNHHGFLLVLSLLMTGCTTTEWSKGNVSPVEKNKAITKCRAMALEKLPPDNKLISEQKEGQKSGKGHRINEDYEKNYNYTDENEDSREIIFNNCMYDAGWESTQRKTEFTGFFNY